MFIINYDLIAQRAFEEDIFKYQRYKAGDKDKDKAVYKGVEGKNYPVLMLEENLVNNEGMGLRKGFYEVRPSSDFDYLILYQSGEIKAKVPIISVEQMDKTPPKKMSKWKKERIRKKGIVPEEYTISCANIYYDKQTGVYLLIYEYKNTKIKGVIKI